jgi:hypothetical protein
VTMTSSLPLSVGANLSLPASNSNESVAEKVASFAFGGERNKRTKCATGNFVQ